MKKNGRVKLWFFFIIRISVAAAGVAAVIRGNWIYFGMSVLTILVMFLPSVIEKKLRIELPNAFDIVVVVFIYAAVFLGDTNEFFDKFWWWDIMLHSVSGLIIGYIGFTIVSLLNYNKKVGISLSPAFVAVFSFCFTLAIGALWEIYEYTADFIFGFNMQRNSLDDTMTDLIMDGIGAIVFSVLGYLYLKGRLRIISRFSREIEDKNNNIS